jgi:hypothetical protein
MSFGSLIRLAAAPMFLSAVATAACWAAAGGNSLGLYLGPVALVALIVPPLVAAARDRLAALIVAGAVIDGVGVVWLLAALLSRTTLLQWLECYLVLAAFAWALCGLVRVLRSAALVTCFALAWLTWPVWMSPWLNDSIVAWLTPAHPLLAANHVLLDLGVWTQQRLMYAFTALGQDVPYTLPRSIGPCIVLHGIVGLTALWSPRPRRGQAASSTPPETTSASAAGA